MGDPGNFRDEVARYEREAERRIYEGPRYRMTYRTMGDGPLLVLLPGLASTYQGYAPTLVRLAARFQTIVLDYPGEHADDGADLTRITHENLVDDLVGLLDHLGHGSALLFGLSFGSTITLSALKRFPSRFPKAVLQGGFAHRNLSAVEKVALGVGRRFRGTCSRLPFHEFALARRNKFTFPGGDPDRWSDYVEENGRTPIASLSHRLDLVGRLDLRALLPEIGQEVLLIHGTADRIVPLGRYEELKSSLRNSTGILMPGVGHQPHWTHPEALADLVGDFFAAGSRVDP